MRRLARTSLLSATLLVLAVFLGGVGAGLPAHAAVRSMDDDESRPVPRLVVAAYFPWYGTPSGPTGQWAHWLGAGGNLLTKDHPPVLYDSGDAATIVMQLATAQRFGVDAFAVSWWGAGTQEDQNFHVMLDTASAVKSPLKLAAQFETPRMAADGTLGIIMELTYLLKSYSDHPAYLRVKGRPVVFLYNPEFFTEDDLQWAAIMADPAIAAFNPLVIVDSYGDAEASIFDGLYQFAPFGPNYPSDPAALATKYQNAAVVAKAHHRIFVAAVAPGFDDSVVRTPSMIVPRNNFQTYSTTWATALAARPDWIFIDSWNEWHEATELEPSLEYGLSYLALTKLWSYVFEHPDLWPARTHDLDGRGDRRDDNAKHPPKPFTTWWRGIRR